MKRAMLSMLMVFLLILGAVAVASAEPTEAEMQAFQAAMAKYQQSMGGGGMPFQTDPNQPPPDPTIEPPTPEQLKQEAVLAFQSFITTYPESELASAAQNYIGWCYFELNNLPQSKEEFGKVASLYPSSTMVDDARYQIAFIEFVSGNYDAALAGFQGVVTAYEGNANEALSHKVPFAYFMVGDCYRMKNDMEKARAKWNELIAKFPTHSQAGRAKKRLNP